MTTNMTTGVRTNYVAVQYVIYNSLQLFENLHSPAILLRADF